jgi:outer membrane protein OmpA-like peptidoglycan-associated protein
MGRRKLSLALILTAAVGSTLASGCATKKYVRQRIDERVAPVEKQTGELAEVSRRNSADIQRLNTEVSDARTRADRAQQTADSAQAAASEAGARADRVNQRVDQVYGEVTGKIGTIDAYTLSKTVTVTFKVGQSKLSDEAMAALDQLAAELQGKKGFVLEIQGFTDARGSNTVNEQLSDRRARAVYEYLARKHEVPLFRMTLLGFGKDRPVGDNKTREGREQNRRVEVRLLTTQLSDVSAAG